MTNAEARKTRNEVERLKRELKQANAELERIERHCHHSWGPTTSDPIVHSAYTTEEQKGFGSHPPIPSIYVPEKRVARWKRVCERCGKVEHTQRAQEHKSVTKTPVW